MPIDLVDIKHHLAQYRQTSYRYQDNLRLTNARQAVDFVNERGFIFFWPNKGIELPSLWGAVAGDRPVPNNHDDPAHITWRWKDDLLDKRQWYYGRILCRRNTIISLRMLPFFYALSPNYGTPDEDYLIEYEQGKLGQAEKVVFEALLEQGPMHTLALRQAAHLASAENAGRFSRALDNLQRDFRVLPVGTAEAGAWHYSFVYDVTHRTYPDLPQQAQPVRKREAMNAILSAYFQSVGGASARDAQRTLGWAKAELQGSLSDLVTQNLLMQIDLNSTGSSKEADPVLQTFFMLPEIQN